MSTTRFAKLARDLHEATANAAWTQWPVLGGQAAAPRAPVSIVDPEALVLLSLWLMDSEPRLWDFLTGLAESASRLLSVQRVKRLMITFPDDPAQRVGTFAATVARLGNDARWRKLAGVSAAKPGRTGKFVHPGRRLAEPMALMLRLRTGFGVDVRTDVLAYLIGRAEDWSDIRETADALGYARFSVRSACDALVAARFIEASNERPVRYYANATRWGAFLGFSDPPPWRPWVRVYVLALRLLDWFRDHDRQARSPTLSASLAREFIVDHGGVLRQLQLEFPDERDYRDTAYLPAFEETVSAFTQWLIAHA